MTRTHMTQPGTEQTGERLILAPEVLTAVQAAMFNRITDLEALLVRYIARDIDDEMSDNRYYTSGAARAARERINKTQAKIDNLREAFEGLGSVDNG